MDTELNTSFSDDFLLVASSPKDISSSTGEMITVDRSTLERNLLDDDDDEEEEDDHGLDALLEQRRRLAAELKAMGGGGVDDSESDEGEIADDNDIDEGKNESTKVDARSEDYSTDVKMENFFDGVQGAMVKREPMIENVVNDDISDPNNSFDEDDFDDEVDKLLEEGLANGASAAAASSCPVDNKFAGLSQPPAVKTKVVLKKREVEYFEVLPDGWLEVTHSSGIPVYLHKASRVCTLARPYFIGPGSVRNHDAPISAIPCYYQRKMQEIASEHNNDGTVAMQNGASADAQLLPPPDKKFKAPPPAVKVQTAEDFKNRNVNAQQLREYCSRAFEFQTINVYRFKSWADHRAYRRKAKQQHSNAAAAVNEVAAPSIMDESMESAGDGRKNGTNNAARPSLPSNVKLITVPHMERGSKPQQKAFFINPQGRTSIAILHEYVQKVMKGSVKYDFSETRNAANPYSVVVRIATSDRNRTDGTKGSGEQVWIEYGKGDGNSKKNAKLNAAKEALCVLVPGVDFNTDGIADSPQDQGDDVGKLFDLIKIVDSRVPELSAKAGQPTPFVILQECLKRHSSFGDTAIKMDIKRIKHQQHEFTMEVGKHEVKVNCTNKKEGKQRAAQAMLEKLHPQISTWGSLIRLYGYGAQRKLQETRKEHESIIRLQVQNNKQHQQHQQDAQQTQRGGAGAGGGHHHNEADEPNMAILEKLKSEMGKLYEQAKTKDRGATTSTDFPFTSAVKNIDI